ncbi:MAG: stage II sporulation protein M [Thermococcus sp.]|nr:stage II sporulation protein M [Thermococcus sp.]
MTGLIVVFLAASFVGYFYSLHNPENTLQIVKALTEHMGPPPASDLRTFLKIFTNNTVVAVFSMLSGLFFGIGPWLIMAFNGFIVGVVVCFVTETGKYPFTQALLGLLPHGIVEIPALAIAGAAGILWYREIVKGEGSGAERFKNGMKKALMMLVVSVLLLFVAALIETYVTPKVSGIG